MLGLIRQRFTIGLLFSTLTLGTTLMLNTPATAISLPAGFGSEQVVTGLTSSTAITFAPDGRLFIGHKDGRVRIFQNGTLLATDFINISTEVNNYWDRGLLGIAVHPNFPATPYVYLLYVYDPLGTVDNGSGARVSRLIRVTADAQTNYNTAIPDSTIHTACSLVNSAPTCVLLGTNSNLANIGDPASNTNSLRPSCDNILNGTSGYVRDCLPADSPSHTIGTVMFGLDGKLFVGNGDGSHFNYTDPRALRALDAGSLSGKILRIDPITGDGLPDNPFYNGDPTSNASKVYNLGLRNPFRFTISPFNGEPYIGDVGWNSWEEINTGRGENFGWPCYEGNNTGSLQQSQYKTQTTETSTRCSQLYAQGITAVEAPTYAYDHSVGGAAIQAGAFYTGTTYPAQYRQALFYEDYNRDSIKYLTFDVNGVATSHDFALDVSPNGGPVDLITGPDTNLYYAVYNEGTNTSEIRRIRYTSATNSPPIAKATANPTSGVPPLTVQFSSSGSSDPDNNQPLTYSWTFGDGGTSTAANPTHVYGTGIFTAILTVKDSQNATNSDQVTITVGNDAPVATILNPVNGSNYSIGDVIVFNGTGTDKQDGPLTGASLAWEVILHHNEHIHFNFFNGTGNSGSFPVPDHGDNTWLELCLTATDRGGLFDTPLLFATVLSESTPEKLSIAVLPFDNLSGDPEQQYFSDGITNDLITDLSRFSGLIVIASNSTFTYRGEGVEARQVSSELGIRYVVQGSIQRSGGRVRINAQLIDATTSAHLWGKRYDREAASLFAIQDELVEAIVTELAVKLDLVERDRAKRKMPENLSAYELWLRSRDHLRARKKEDNATARALLEKAVQLDPTGARYFADLAMAHLHESWWGWSDSQDRSLQVAEDLAHRGVALDDADYWTHWVLADVLRAKSDFSGAQAAYERAYALNPNDADLLADFGRLHIYLGRADESIRRIEKAIRLNPLHPDWYLIALALANFFTGNYQTIIDLVHKARQANPGLLRLLVAAHIMLDQRDQADQARAEMMRLEPWFTIATLRKALPFKDPAVGAPFFAALRKAGLPE
jgi:TolB-like protein/glucose/arabinose dehydrogenase/Flp pilus assembly protein TadD